MRWIQITVKEEKELVRNENGYIFPQFNEIHVDAQNWMKIRWIQITMKDEKELVRNENEYFFSQFNEICVDTQNWIKMDSSYHQG